MSDEGYECPECGADVEPDMIHCPGCGIEFEVGSAEGEREETAASAEPDRGETAPSQDGDEGDTDDASDGEDAASGRPQQDEPEPSERATTEPVQTDKVRSMSRWGVTTAVLSGLALGATLLLLRWDTWVVGAAEDSIGSRQLLGVISCFAAFTVLMIITLVDILRKKAAPQA